MSAPHKCYGCFSSFSDKYLQYLEGMQKLRDLPRDELEKAEQQLIQSLVKNWCCRALMKTIIRRPEQMVL